MKFKIILSADCIKQGLTGVGRYAFELACYFRHHPQIESLKFYKHRRVFNRFPMKQKPINRYPEKFLRSLMKRNLFSSLYPLFSQDLSSINDHIFHGTDFNIPDYQGISVATIHDIALVRFPHFHKNNAHNGFENLSAILKKASLIFTPCQFVKNDIIEVFNHPAEKIRVTYEASSGIFSPLSATHCYPTLKKWGLQYKQFILCLSTIEPRKNIPTLIEAYEKLPLSIKNHYPLVLIGHKGWQSETIHEKIHSAQRKGWLKYLGFVADADLQKILPSAALFVFPSYYEGFGLPVLEAMASGVPVICSNTSSLPEVAGEAALMFNPYQVESITLSLQRGIEDSQWQKFAINKGFEQNKKFSWKQCAEETLLGYRSAINR